MIRILAGDCRERMAELDADSIDSAVGDPPYHLTSIVKRFGREQSHLDVPAHKDHEKVKAPQYKRLSRGFMGQTWDGGDVAFQVATWEAVYRVLKPGAHLVMFSGTRTYHRMVCAIEDAGFEIRDQLAWVYGAGFPKSHNMDHRRGKEFCGCDDRTETLSERELRLVRDSDLSAPFSVGSAGGEILFESLPEQGSPRPVLRTEPEEVAPVAPQWRMEGRGDAQEGARELQGRSLREGAGVGSSDGSDERLYHGASAGDGEDVRLPADADGSGQSQGSQSREQRSVEPGAVADERGPQAWGGWPLCRGCGKPDIPRGLGTALKPAWEPIVLARKPLIGTVAANMAAHGTGALNIDGCRIGTETVGWGGARGGSDDPTQSQGRNYRMGEGEPRPVEGRWPANIIHDGSDEVLAAFPEAPGQQGDLQGHSKDRLSKNAYGDMKAARDALARGDSGSAARFFYCAKATTDERGEGNNHPTVKPVDLMRWLVRLVTPKGGTVLDPFMGSGSTMIAADMEQMNGIGCELSPEYAAIAERRIRAAAGMFAEVLAA